MPFFPAGFKGLLQCIFFSRLVEAVALEHDALEKIYQAIAFRYQAFHMGELKVAMYIHKARAKQAFIMAYRNRSGAPGLVYAVKGVVVVKCDDTAFGQPLSAVMYLCCAKIFQRITILKNAAS